MKCPTCKGTGLSNIPNPDWEQGGYETGWLPCQTCQGSGQIDSLYLCMKDDKAVLVRAKDSDDAFRTGGKLLGIVAQEVENIDLDTCVEITENVPVDIS